MIIEDVDHSAARFLSHMIKLWCDEGPFRGETKGGSLHIRPRGFVVTSNYKIDVLWSKDQTLTQAIGRRFFQPVLNCREDLAGVDWEVPLRCVDDSAALAAALRNRKKSLQSPAKARAASKLTRFVPAPGTVDASLLAWKRKTLQDGTGASNAHFVEDGQRPECSFSVKDVPNRFPAAAPPPPPRKG